MELTDFEIVFCDLDGTLLEDKMRHYMCYKDIIKQYGGSPIHIDEYWNDKRNKVKCSDLLEKSDFQGPEELYYSEWMQRIEQERYLSYEFLKPNIIKVIDYIRQNVKQLNLVTMRNNKWNLMKQLTYLDIGRYFDCIYVGASALGKKKSDLVQDVYGKRVLIIGDTEDDMELAAKVRGSFLAVTNGLRECKYLRADYYYKELEEIL